MGPSCASFPWDPPQQIRDRQHNNRSPRTPPGTTPQDHPPGQPPGTTLRELPRVSPRRGRDQREGASLMSVIMTLFDLVLAGSLEEEGSGKAATTTTTTATATTTTTTTTTNGRASHTRRQGRRIKEHMSLSVLGLCSASTIDACCTSCLHHQWVITSVDTGPSQGMGPTRT